MTIKGHDYDAAVTNKPSEMSVPTGQGNGPVSLSSPGGARVGPDPLEWLAVHGRRNEARLGPTESHPLQRSRRGSRELYNICDASAFAVSPPA